VHTVKGGSVKADTVGNSQFEHVAESNSSPKEDEAHGARHHPEQKAASTDNKVADDEVQHSLACLLIS